MAKRRPRAAAKSVVPEDFAANHARLLAQALTDPESLPGMREQEGNPRTLAPRVLDVDEWKTKQIERTVAAAQTWKDHTLRPRKDPVAAARAAAPKYKVAMEKALREGNFEKGLAAVDEAAMIDAIEKTDPADFARAVQKREMKIGNKLTKLRPLLVAHCEAVDAMPDSTEQEREAKMLANKRGMQAVGVALKKA